jgi:23S rRNA (adenine2030-N6)-methyltransferase
MGPQRAQAAAAFYSSPFPDDLGGQHQLSDNDVCLEVIGTIMFSYRHAFHAGNHADVLKHFVQVQLHKYMNQKDTAYTYIDTHAGAGVYALDSAQALKSGESEGGIARLWERDDLPAALADYVDLVRAMNPSGKLRYYPGSPYVAEQCARLEDRLRLFELHPADVKLLDQNIRKLEAHKAEQGERARGRRIIVDRADGFQSLKALLPPPSRRALVLCDPPYEVKLDYKHVYDALGDALGRFPSGTYAIWYPVLQRMESRQFADRLKRLPAKEWLHVTLTVATPGPDGTGMHSSGMFILNPPYTLEATLRETMPYLVKVLGTDSGATFRIETGTQATGAMPGRAGALAGRTGTGPRVPVGNARRASPLGGRGSLRLPGQAYEAPARPRAQGEDEEGAKRATRRQFYKTPPKPEGDAPGKRDAGPAPTRNKSPARPAGGPAGAPRKVVKRSGPSRG